MGKKVTKANDRQKKEDGSQNFLVDSVRRSAQATATIAGGFASAIGDGVSEYGENLTNESITRLAMNNGFWEGTLAGYAKFFDTMADTARKALDDVRDAPEFSMMASSRVEIDYKLLASEIATKEFAAEIATKEFAAEIAKLIDK